MKKLNRREFLKDISYVVVGLSLAFDPGFQIDNNRKSLIVRIHDSRASKPWDYKASYPWNHSVEPVTIEGMNDSRIRGDRYFNYINEDIVSMMFRRGLNELAGTKYTRDAWKKLLKQHDKPDKCVFR